MKYALSPQWGAIDILGIIIDGAHVPAFLAMVGVLGAALIAAIPVTIKHRADKRASVTTELRALYETLKADRADDTVAWEKKFREQGDKIDALQDQVTALLFGKQADRDRINKLEDQVRDLSDENEDLWGYARALIRWEDAGGTPPLPARPWRIRDHLARANGDGLL